MKFTNNVTNEILSIKKKPFEFLAKCESHGVTMVNGQEVELFLTAQKKNTVFELEGVVFLVTGILTEDEMPNGFTLSMEKAARAKKVKAEVTASADLTNDDPFESEAEEAAFHATMDEPEETSSIIF